MYHPGYMHPYVPPGYIHYLPTPGTPLDHHRCRTRYHGNTGRDSLTALRRVVTELTVADRRVTVTIPVSLLVSC